jgi:putative Mg2+ transporter-C (MgtC) family protein
VHHVQFDLVPNSLQETAIRLLAAMVVGGIVGLDREWRQKPAGLRTHMLVCLAAATFTVLAGHISLMSRELGVQADPVRIIEAVTAGVAFLGAGAIFRSGDSVQGLSTGASVWLAGAMGVACGGGFYELAALTTVLALVVLTLLGFLQHHILKAVDENGKAAPAKKK